MKETTIQRTVFDHLRRRGAPGVFAFHPRNGSRDQRTLAGYNAGLGVKSGVPDVVIIHNGRIFGLELKTEIGRLSDAQIDAQTEMEMAGACVFTAYGLDQAIHALEFWGLVRGNCGVS